MRDGGQDEFELRNSGVTYAEIAAKGGGIKRSVAQVQSALGRGYMGGKKLRRSHVGRTPGRYGFFDEAPRQVVSDSSGRLGIAVLERDAKGSLWSVGSHSGRKDGHRPAELRQQGILLPGNIHQPCPGFYGFSIYYL